MQDLQGRARLLVPLRVRLLLACSLLQLPLLVADVLLQLGDSGSEAFLGRFGLLAGRFRLLALPLVFFPRLLQVFLQLLQRGLLSADVLCLGLALQGEAVLLLLQLGERALEAADFSRRLLVLLLELPNTLLEFLLLLLVGCLVELQLLLKLCNR